MARSLALVSWKESNAFCILNDLNVAMIVMHATVAASMRD